MTKDPTIFSVEIFMEGESPVIVQTKNGRKQEAFATEVFVNVVRKNGDGHDTALFHFLKGCEPTVAGREIQRFLFHREMTDSIKIDLAEEEVSYGAILRLCVFAHTDLGIFLVSAYPNVKGMARQLVMLASHRPKHVAIAQHFMASWALDVYSTLRSE